VTTATTAAAARRRVDRRSRPHDAKAVDALAAVVAVTRLRAGERAAALVDRAVEPECEREREAGEDGRFHCWQVLQKRSSVDEQPFAPSGHASSCPHVTSRQDCWPLHVTSHAHALPQSTV
jgi:hypothetical protein